MEIKGAIVTIDAMGCQKEIAHKIREQEADYLLALKGNQGTLHEDVKLFIETEVAKNKSEKITNNGWQKITKVSDATATRDIQHLVEFEILEKKGKGRGVHYVFKNSK